MRCPGQLSFVLLAVAGCAIVQPQLSEPEAQAFAEIRTFAYQIADVYKVRRIWVQVGSVEVFQAAGIYRFGTFYVGPQTLKWSRASWEVLVAHEMAHYLLGHERMDAGIQSIGQWRAIQQQREMDADAKAVEILHRVAGKNEQEAFLAVYCYLDRGQRRGQALPDGHPPWHEKLADLERRYPAHIEAIAKGCRR